MSDAVSTLPSLAGESEVVAASLPSSSTEVASSIRNRPQQADSSSPFQASLHSRDRSFFSSSSTGHAEAANANDVEASGISHSTSFFKSGKEGTLAITMEPYKSFASSHAISPALNMIPPSTSFHSSPISAISASSGLPSPRVPDESSSSASAHSASEGSDLPPSSLASQTPSSALPCLTLLKDQRVLAAVLIAVVFFFYGLSYFINSATGHLLGATTHYSVPLLFNALGRIAALLAILPILWYMRIRPHNLSLALTWSNLTSTFVQLSGLLGMIAYIHLLRYGGDVSSISPCVGLYSVVPVVWGLTIRGETRTIRKLGGIALSLVAVLFLGFSGGGGSEEGASSPAMAAS